MTRRNGLRTIAAALAAAGVIGITAGALAEGAPATGRAAEPLQPGEAPAAAAEGPASVPGVVVVPGTGAPIGRVAPADGERRAVPRHGGCRFDGQKLDLLV